MSFGFGKVRPEFKKKAFEVGNQYIGHAELERLAILGLVRSVHQGKTITYRDQVLAEIGSGEITAADQTERQNSDD